MPLASGKRDFLAPVLLRSTIIMPLAAGAGLFACPSADGKLRYACVFVASLGSRPRARSHVAIALCTLPLGSVSFLPLADGKRNCLARCRGQACFTWNLHM